MKQLNNKIQQQLKVLENTGRLFRSSFTGQQVWDLYLASFKEDPIFRDPQSTEHNCNLCNNFLRRYGNIVSIDENYKIITLFDFDIEGEYEPIVKALSQALQNAPIQDVFFETFNELNSLPYEKCTKSNSVFRLGVNKNTKRYTKEEAEKFGVVKPNQEMRFEHMHLDLSSLFVDTTGKSVESIMNDYRSAKDVFQRGLEVISTDTLELVRDLINQGSLLNGTTYLPKIEKFIELAKEYSNLSAKERINWYWVRSFGLPNAKFKNELIGVLCTELAEGMELNKACANWNKREDPTNKMKPTAPITKKQIEEAKKFVEDNGYSESFDRRFANIDDIKVSEILHANAGKGEIRSVSIFDGVKATSTRHKRNEFEGIEEVPIEKFMKDILPTCTSVEAFLQNNQGGNLVTLTTANISDSKPIFKWDNNYSWTYKGNLSGKSQLAEMVEAKGGRTDGVFRFTHSWNELEPNRSLMDLHVFMPGNEHKDDSTKHETYGKGRRVGWNQRNDSLSGGVQDVDYTSEAPAGYIPVENITFPTLSKMPEGKYICKIHNWSFRKSGGRGKAEIAFEGNVYQYEYPATKNLEWITIAEITLKNGRFSIDHKLPLVGETSKELYGLDTNQFHKVNLICLSPNHWGNNSEGHKHYFFMLDNCKTDVSIRSFHNENLIAELYDHKRVMEVLANTNMISPTDKQLSGLGYNSTISDNIILRLSGSFKRTIRVNFGNG